MVHSLRCAGLCCERAGIDHCSYSGECVKHSAHCLSRAQRHAGACDSDFYLRPRVPGLSHQRPRDWDRILGSNWSDGWLVNFGLWLLLYRTWTPLLLAGDSCCDVVRGGRACLGAKSLPGNPRLHRERLTCRRRPAHPLAASIETARTAAKRYRRMNRVSLP